MCTQQGSIMRAKHRFRVRIRNAGSRASFQPGLFQRVCEIVDVILAVYALQRGLHILSIMNAKGFSALNVATQSGYGVGLWCVQR